MFKKIGLIVFVAGIVLANNVFAAETQIEVNGLTVTVNRELGVHLEELGEGAEAYGITIDDRLIGEALTLKNLRFDFIGTGNYLSINEDKTISAKIMIMLFQNLLLFLLLWRHALM